ncbi:3'-5' exonuclease [Marinitoga sp. 38H-ov]|uniref:3'-5' exonuclease n=1 Tax=Marinitoga sp. 38H-ov TaxID=1755814 RepID=UPI0013EB525B|nr:3'-5' exonuclease [Marinitoga sp. 38H-ov]KAF2957027.1 DNA polymerase III subunit epsilon [Marinitoga sp. 38H-ov]
MNQQVFVSFDLETTGLKPYLGDRIIEIAAIPIFNGKIKRKYEFHTLVNPNIKIPVEGSQFHKLNNKDIENAPTIIEVFPKFKEYISDTILVSHNIKMDMMFLDLAAKESGILPVDNYYIDTLEIAKELLGKGPYSLEHLAKKFNVYVGKSHRAYEDALMTARVFLFFVNKFGIKSLRDFIKKWRG